MKRRIKAFIEARQGLLAFVLLAFWPFAHFIYHNRKILRADEVGLVLAIWASLIIVAGLAAEIIVRLFKRRNQAACYALMGTMCLLFFSYDGIVRGIHLAIENLPSLSVGINHMYAGLCVVVVGLVVLFVAKLSHGITILTVFAASAVFFPVAGFTAHTIGQLMNDDGHKTADISPKASFRNRPNVYYFVTDEYGRHDQVKQVTGYDNTPFLKWIEQQGFAVSRSSYSNYPVTFLSLASSLSMDYPYRDAENVLNRQYAHRVIGGDNAVVRHFRNNGYYYFHAPAVLWNGSRCSGAEDVCLQPASVVGNELTTNLLRMTPLFKIMQRYMLNSSWVATFENLLPELDKVRHHQPFFVFFHSLLPHPPQIYRPDCSLKIDASIRLSDTTTPGAKSETPEGFLDNLKCANKQLEYAISHIKRQDPTAIIIVHADHGTPFTVDWMKDPREWTGAQLKERFAIQMAMHLPKQCGGLFYEGISPVNVFELVFACLEERKPVYKPDESYGFIYEIATEGEQPVWKVNIPVN